MLRYYFRLLFSVILLFFWVLPALDASSHLVLNEEEKSYYPGLFLELAEDPSNSWSIDQVSSAAWSSQFKKINKIIFKLGNSSSSWWIKLRIENQTDVSNWVIENNHPFLTQFDMYIKQGEQGYRRISRGTETPIQQRTENFRLPLFQLDDLSGQDSTLYFHVSNDRQIFISLWMLAEKVYAKQEQTKQLMHGVYYGAMGGMMLYTLFLFINLRERVYLDYTLLTLATMMMSFTINGYAGLLLFPANLDWGVTVFGFSVSLYIFFALSTTQSFLQTQQLSPLTHRFINILKFISICSIYVPLIPGVNPFVLMLALILATCTIIVVSVQYLSKGDVSARFFVLARSFPPLALLGITLVFLGFLEVKTGGYTIFQFSSFLEIIFLSLALAVRAGKLRREKELAQKDALNAHQESVRQLQEKNQFKDQLLANTSHELRTPLHVVSGLMETVQESLQAPLFNEQRKMLELALSSIRRVNRLVGDLLDLSAIRNTKLNMKLSEVNLHALAKNVLRQSSPQLNNKNIRLDNLVPPNLPSIYADPDRLQQVLFNLVENSIKFTTNGSISVTATTEDNYILIQVVDTGSGIIPGQQEKIFQAFDQGESNAGITMGLGLGLSICKELVEAHAGKIWLDASSEKGSVFSFTLPLAQSSLSIIPQGSKVEDSASSTILETVAPEMDQEVENLIPLKGKGLHILAVDDDITNLHVIRGYLSTEDFQVTFCTESQEVLDLLAQSKVNLILLDVLMPGLDGLELCELIREHYSQEELPVLLLTALNGDEDIANGYASGANDYLCKPLKKQELLARISVHLKLSQYLSTRLLTEEKERRLPREALVALVTTTLFVWEQASQLSIIDLAQESKTWGTHLEATGAWRARGLEKYLTLATLPQHPRWRKVLQTVQYVLDNAPIDDEQRQKLNSALNLFNQLQQKHSL
ncbi:MAG: response regulator [SAR324 cluster bacterium]|nr:response regulator [SAR324 cluster bacterium]